MYLQGNFSVPGSRGSYGKEVTRLWTIDDHFVMLTVQAHTSCLNPKIKPFDFRTVRLPPKTKYLRTQYKMLIHKMNLLLKKILLDIHIIEVMKNEP